MKRLIALLLLLLIAVPVVATTNSEAEQVQQQARDNLMNWASDQALSSGGTIQRTANWINHLPSSLFGFLISEPQNIFIIPEWYGVAEWEVETCMRGVSTKKLTDDEGNAFQPGPVPLVRDTYSIVALVTKGDPIDYYDLGFYLQPFQNKYNVTVTVRTKFHGVVQIWPKPSTHKDADEREEKDSFAKRLIIPIPCDPDVHPRALDDREVLCFPPFDNPDEEIASVTLRWAPAGATARNLHARVEEVS